MVMAWRLWGNRLRERGQDKRERFAEAVASRQSPVASLENQFTVITTAGTNRLPLLATGDSRLSTRD